MFIVKRWYFTLLCSTWWGLHYVSIKIAQQHMNHTQKWWTARLGLFSWGTHFEQCIHGRKCNTVMEEPKGSKAESKMLFKKSMFWPTKSTTCGCLSVCRVQVYSFQISSSSARTTVQKTSTYIPLLIYSLQTQRAWNKKWYPESTYFKRWHSDFASAKFQFEVVAESEGHVVHPADLVQFDMEDMWCIQYMYFIHTRRKVYSGANVYSTHVSI